MTERCVCSSYKVDVSRNREAPLEIEYELWTETGLREPNFFVLFGGVEQDLDQFTEDQLKAMGQYVADWRAPGGRF